VLAATGSLLASASPAAGASYGVGTNPVAIARGDFNADGHPDLATANQKSDTVAVLLGRGDGTFRDALRSAAADGPSSVATGDFDLNGKRDVVVANPGLNKVSILRGRGNGEFRPPRQVTVGENPVNVAVGRFNADAVPDIAVANRGGDNQMAPGSVQVLLGKGDGTFTSGTPMTANAPIEIAVADMDRDGRRDLVVGAFPYIAPPDYDPQPNLLVYYGNGDGTFDPPDQLTAPDPQKIAIGDFSGDHRPDVAVSNFNNGTASLLLGKPFGGLGPAKDIGIVGCFSGDLVPLRIGGAGTHDLAVIEIECGGDVKPRDRVAFFHNNGDGTFDLPFFTKVGRWATGIVKGRFNADNAPDIAVSNGVSNSVTVLIH
jgi:hypothetical protein